jgi:hypothetical protein
MPEGLDKASQPSSTLVGRGGSILPKIPQNCNRKYILSRKDYPICSPIFGDSESFLGANVIFYNPHEAALGRVRALDVCY